MKYLQLIFSGVTQYYSSNTSTTLRENYQTSICPTKRAVVGLISAAFGYNRDNVNIKALESTLSIKYKTLKNPVILNDFQTIRPLKSQDYYMNVHRPKNLLKTVAGGTKESALIKKIEYLQDAQYEVYIGGDEELLKSIYDAIQNPVYDLHFGKRSCIPNEPIVKNFVLIEEEDLDDVHNCA